MDSEQLDPFRASPQLQDRRRFLRPRLTGRATLGSALLSTGPRRIQPAISGWLRGYARAA